MLPCPSPHARTAQLARPGLGGLVRPTLSCRAMTVRILDKLSSTLSSLPTPSSLVEHSTLPCPPPSRNRGWGNATRESVLSSSCRQAVKQHRVMTPQSQLERAGTWAPNQPDGSGDPRKGPHNLGKAWSRHTSDSLSLFGQLRTFWAGEVVGWLYHGGTVQPATELCVVSPRLAFSSGTWLAQCA